MSAIALPNRSYAANIFSPLVIVQCGVALAITGSKKLCNEGAPLFTAGVDGLVSAIHFNSR
jgi:hypothetical protein